MSSQSMKLATFTLSFVAMSHSYLEFQLQHSEQLEGDKEKFIDFSSLKVKKLNQTFRALDGKVTYHIQLDNSFDLEGKFYKKQGGEYRILPYRLPRLGFCAFIKDKFFYPDLAAVSDLPLPAPCPFTAGTYTINGYVPSLKNIPTVLLQTGDYAIEAIAWKNTKLLLRWRIYTSIINL